MARALDDADCSADNSRHPARGHDFSIGGYVCCRCGTHLEYIRLPHAKQYLIHEDMKAIEHVLMQAKRDPHLSRWVPVCEQALQIKTPPKPLAWKTHFVTDFVKSGHTSFGKPAPVDGSEHTFVVSSGRRFGKTTAMEAMREHEKELMRYRDEDQRKEDTRKWLAGVAKFPPLTVKVTPENKAELEAMMLRTKHQENKLEIRRDQIEDDRLGIFSPIYIHDEVVVELPAKCKFKGCPKFSLRSSHLCFDHKAELTKLESGAGISPQYRYVTQAAGHKNVIVTVDVGADWE